jgi:hypothetical protein
LAIIGSCFTDDTETNECQKKFLEILNTKCAAIGSCTLNEEDYNCYETKECSQVNVASCASNIPPKLHEQKCVVNSANNACEATPKLCADFNKYGGSSTTTIRGDICSKLSPPANEGNRCDISGYTPSPCYQHFDLCTDVKGQTQCGYNLPKDPLYKCEWKASETTKCQPVKFECLSYTRTPDKTICPGLQVTGTDDTDRGNKKCIYTGSICEERYKLCEHYSNSETTCNSRMPLNTAGNDYNYSKRCSFDTTENRCKEIDRYCSEYNIYPTLTPSDEICEQLKAKDTNKRCIYKDGVCKEEYKTCELYNEKEIDKSETACEDIQLQESNKECIYIPKEDKCETRAIYETCESYTGSDKEICESILSPTTNFYCILEKDLTCKERPSLCKYATSKKDCIYYAKASDDNKRCAYDDDTTPSHTPRCYEEYARCEDYHDQDEDECEEIRLYNGNSCVFKDNRCQSKNKICSDALTEEECKLINVTGVADTDRMVCDYVQYSGRSKSCVENYKYCSDYRGYTADICNNIKPYDESGNSLDKYFKCKIVDSNVGCEKVPIDCEDAGSNAILCAEYSTKIKDSSVKYCAFYQNTCKTQFKTCEGVVNFSPDNTKCTDNIIENYITKVCEVNSSGKCVKKQNCVRAIDRDSYAYLCNSINTNCSYDDSMKVCYTDDKSCSRTKFYPGIEGTEEICNSIAVNEPYMICSLKEDKSGCEKKYKETRYAPVGSKQQENTSSSGFIERRISVIMILLCLLF